jgi:putative ABC transport system permease protein
MFKSYFKTALRNIFRNKLFSVINILGLSVGIACAFLILITIQDDLSYDQFFEDKDQIYRVVLDRKYPENTVSYAIIPYSMGDAMVQDLPEVLTCTRAFKIGGEFVMIYEDRTFKENYAAFADSTFFEFFGIPILEGDPKQILSMPNGIALSESTARKYFGEQDPLGKNLTIPLNDQKLTVTGVFKDIPDHSHMKFDIIASIKATGLDQAPNFISFSVFTYIKLKKDTPPSAIEVKLPMLVDRYAAGQIETQLGIGYKEYTEAGNGYHYYLQPLTSIHLNSHLENEIRPNANKTYVYILAGIALFLVVIASINFMNLSTARSADRAREVGMRKVVGSHKSQLIAQFLTESVVITFVSLTLAIVFVELFLPSFNTLSGKALEINYLDNWFTIPVLLLIGVIIGVLAGSYPAFVLSQFRPTVVLKGRFTRSGKGTFLRNTLVVFQFWISIILISTTILVIRQMKYFQNTDLGFDRENIITIQRAGVLMDQLEAYKQELLKHPNIIAATASSTEISGGYYPGIFFQTSEKQSEVMTSRGMTVDDDFIQTYQLKILKGRGFSRDFNDSLSILINESAVREFQLDDPVGATLYSPQDGENPTLVFRVVGVVQDFHYGSLHSDIKSFVLWSHEGPIPGMNLLSVKIKKDQQSETLSYIERKWNEFIPENPITYHHLEDDIYSMYQNEETSTRIFGIFTLLAILIACVGLFGLAAHTAAKRTKEIGIRKVMGATIPGIVQRLSSDFTRLVLIAFLLAIPVALIFMRQWLMNFAYKTSINVWIFLLAGMLALVIALITVSFHAIRAASTNPADALRYE